MEDQYEYTPEGCRLAREFLDKRNMKIDPGWTGWEIIYQANAIKLAEQRITTKRKRQRPVTPPRIPGHKEIA